MKTLRSLSFLVLFAALISTATTRAQVPPLLPVPDSLPAADKTDLQSKREELLTRLGALREQAKAYNAEFGNRNLPDNDPRVPKGLAEKARLDQARQAYVRAAEAFNSLVQSRSQVGAVAESRGEFYFITPDGRKITGEEVVKTPVSTGTRIIMGPNGYLRLKLLDDTVFTLGPNCDLVVDEFVYDPDNHLDKTSARLLKGVFRFVTGKVARKDPTHMKVTLPVGDLGNRGTDCEAMVAPDDSGSVKLYSGQLEITEKKTQRAFLLNAGQMVTFSAEGVFSPPLPLEPAVAKLEDCANGNLASLTAQL
jgi:hypothetical protein